MKINGFTLIEFLIVLAIFSILVVIAAPVIYDYVDPVVERVNHRAETKIKSINCTISQFCFDRINNKSSVCVRNGTQRAKVNERFVEIQRKSGKNSSFYEQLQILEIYEMCH